ncbi:hypothetical protein [Lentilitoribacter sp. EG35]|uniref:aldose epimerase family protein n=1 Tax=Lentilitoribacter sp. EG35 TaxID=3234192 RepID=UPI00345F8B67
MTPTGFDGRSYSKHSGICLEPQGWPDAVNHKDFPNTILKPGSEYYQHTQYASSKSAN